MTTEHKAKRYVLYQEIGHGDTYAESTFLRDALARTSAAAFTDLMDKIKARAELSRENNTST